MFRWSQHGAHSCNGTLHALIRIAPPSAPRVSGAVKQLHRCSSGSESWGPIFQGEDSHDPRSSPLAAPPRSTSTWKPSRADPQRAPKTKQRARPSRSRRAGGWRIKGRAPAGPAGMQSGVKVLSIGRKPKPLGRIHAQHISRAPRATLAMSLPMRATRHTSHARPPSTCTTRARPHRMRRNPGRTPLSWSSLKAYANGWRPMQPTVLGHRGARLVRLTTGAAAQFARPMRQHARRIPEPARHLERSDACRRRSAMQQSGSRGSRNRPIAIRRVRPRRRTRHLGADGLRSVPPTEVTSCGLCRGISGMVTTVSVLVPAATAVGDAGGAANDSAHHRACRWSASG